MNNSKSLENKQFSNRSLPFSYLLMTFFSFIGIKIMFQQNEHYLPLNFSWLRAENGVISFRGETHLSFPQVLCTSFVISLTATVVAY
jgi:hypothetical protein